jgi:hypothetical protein
VAGACSNLRCRRVDVLANLVTQERTMSEPKLNWRVAAVREYADWSWPKFIGWMVLANAFFWLLFQ